MLVIRIIRSILPFWCDAYEQEKTNFDTMSDKIIKKILIIKFTSIIILKDLNVTFKWLNTYIHKENHKYIVCFSEDKTHKKRKNHPKKQVIYITIKNYNRGSS